MTNTDATAATLKPAARLMGPDYMTPRLFIAKHGRGATCSRKAWRVEMTIAEWRAAEYTAPCPDCGRSRPAHQIHGRRNDAVKCTAKCIAATGHDCECSCAGKNHGASFAAG